MRLYVSGPIASLGVDVAKPRFEQAAMMLKHCGHDPLNPFTVKVPHHSAMPGRSHWARALTADLRAMLNVADGVATLEGWQYSEGAKLEVMTAVTLDMPVATVQHWMLRGEDVTKLEQEVREERRRQLDKWGVQHHPDGTGQDPLDDVIAKEARSACEELFAQGRGTWRAILWEEVAEAFAAKADTPHLAEELLQVEAVARAWREDMAQRDLTADPSGRPPQDSTGRP